MIFEQTVDSTAEHVPYQRRQMFPLEQHFAFTAAKAPRVTLQRAEMATGRLFRVLSTGHQIRLIEPTYTSVLIPRRGTIEVRTARSTFVARPGDTLLFSPNRRATTVVPDTSGVFECDCLLIPTAAMAEAAAPPRSQIPARSAELVFSGNLAGRRDTALRGYLDFLFTEGMRPHSQLTDRRVRAAASALMQELLGALIDRPDDTGTDRAMLPDEARLVRSAEDIMMARLDQPLTMAELAGHLGVSVRRLQYAFKRVRNATPRTVLSLFRLERARQLLVAPGENCTIARIAMDCGIAHFGRFAAAYAARYGERPSEALRRAQHR